MEYVVTGAFVALFLWAAHRALYLHLRGVRTTGTIIAIVEDKASDGPVFNLVVTFTTRSGETRQQLSQLSGALRQVANCVPNLGKNAAQTPTWTIHPLS
jgi:hypothetical protein